MISSFIALSIINKYLNLSYRIFHHNPLSFVQLPFHALGIPSALFIHSPVEPWYHQPTDTLDKISKEKLQQATEIIGASMYQIARPDTPSLKNARVPSVTVDYDFENRPVD